MVFTGPCHWNVLESGSQGLFFPRGSAGDFFYGFYKTVFREFLAFFWKVYYSLFQLGFLENPDACGRLLNVTGGSGSWCLVV